MNPLDDTSQRLRNKNRMSSLWEPKGDNKAKPTKPKSDGEEDPPSNPG